MTSATRSVAVVATQLPSTDRRALSQAWYSALHVSQAHAATTSRKSAAESPVGAPAAHARPNTYATAGTRPPTAQRERGVRQRAEPADAGVLERRAPATDLSKRIERALLAQVSTAASRPAALAIKAADGRVQLLVRQDGSTTRIIALCTPSLRANVDRALARARFALSATGMRIEAAS